MFSEQYPNLPEKKLLSQTLRISEIFHSIQGESSSVGWPTVFIRLTGCPLRCHYCDTAHAFKGGSLLTLSDVLNKSATYKTRHITVTGGEPLAQPNCLSLLTLLCDHHYVVSLETSGALSLESVDPRVVQVMDLKTPSSGECGKNLFSNLAFLKPTDQIKFVIGDRADFDWTCEVIQHHQLEKRCELLISPVWEKLSPGLLADWLLKSGLNARLQVQLHKILWGKDTHR